ncbi:cyclic beta-(1,2)-glucan synthase NdvB [Rhodoferax lithotrophicus]|uniref:Cyclic beta-(1,2)-glucan synthase NdvB n=1 Tax=Rhodoferax lithotrophicus TaxID=2798804 RepID=A0ABM7MNW9_9BURK|nr:glucoamylase family protein [Rhodoferax sp. MIZ03]BCO28011.1 cyclic beta-(1,2)-glucan synthase NdvB [Rhodoferax sp. MIZ03]
MARPTLRSLLPSAPPALCQILDSAHGVIQGPIRSEIFGPQRFAQHGRSLGQTHRATRVSSHGANFFPRLQNNLSTLREAHHYIGIQANTGYDISPAAEWLLDNFHLIEAQLSEIHAGLPRSYFSALPKLIDEPLPGLPRVYGIAWAFVAHTDGAFDEAMLAQFLCAYQEVCELNLSEMWAFPTTLRVVLIENLRRLAEQVAANKAAREAANLCFDQLGHTGLDTVSALLALLNARGVGRVFLVQLALRLQDLRLTEPSPEQTLFQDWLQQALPDPASTQLQQGVDQAADNLSVSNAITSLRAIGDADWPDIIARTSTLMRLMLTSPVFEAEATLTRDQTLHAIEKLALRCKQSELAVAHTLLALMTTPEATNDVGSVAAHWLQGRGQPQLWQALGLSSRAVKVRQFLAHHLILPAYLGALLGFLSLLLWLLLHRSGSPLGMTLAVLLLALLPASEAVVAVIHRLISESVHPQHLARLALAHGIPSEHRVMVVIPCMLTSLHGTQELVKRLQLHYLANPEPQAQFALLSDWADAPTAVTDTDAALLAQTLQGIRTLNTLYPRREDEANPTPRFILLHRPRHYCESEQCWMGWERKRGKLELLITALAQGHSTAFHDLGEASTLAPGTQYVVTLDSDTQLPPGRLRELVGVAAHPNNLPRLSTDGRTVLGGYGILQPRVATPLPAVKEFTLYHWLFAGQCGIDPYSAASSEIYQDVFAEGSFTGKGLLNVRALHAVLSGRLPENQVLSHDLLEGSMARCAAVSDLAVVEEAPFHADVAASRVHRWTRGDWQLLPFIGSPGHYSLKPIHLWKMLDNLRRSLVAPLSLALLLSSLMGWVLSPWVALALIFAAFSAGPVMGALVGFAPSRSHVAKGPFYHAALMDLARALCGGAWQLAQLMQQSRLALDAIGRALYRMSVSHRHLLQWTTAATAQAQAQTGFQAILRQHRIEPLLALLLLAALLGAPTPAPWLAAALCLLWAASPLGTWWVSRVCPVDEDLPLTPPEQLYLSGIARDTWRLFERCVGPDDLHLPPDNLQTSPHDMLAHRTSPTNIGLYLLGVACARQLGWIGTQDMLTRLEATLGSLLTLQRHRGHFMNWYDTQNGQPLLPMYVSTVDSGNLSGHLLAVAQACRELAQAPFDTQAGLQALNDLKRRLHPLLAQRSTLAAPQRAELKWLLADYRNTLRSANLDVQTHIEQAPSTSAMPERLLALAHALEQLAWQADFSFLYSHRRHLFHIGYRVAEQQRDAGFYDLLASESRLTSLLAIAKGDVPVRHWSALGRPFFAVGSHAGLRSWIGSMFEYLMPSVVLDEPYGSVLHEACHAALREQATFAKVQGVPWGISESAYAASDFTLAYQYAPHGVPRLALRRTPPDELVIAPYATALAAQLSPQLALHNFEALQALGARGRYGFMEALDYSTTGRTGSEPFTLVHTYMAHHQGMSIVALANVLLGGRVQRWGMANAHVQAVSSLLHERVPREIPLLKTLPVAHQLQDRRKRAPGFLRELVAGSSAIEPTHVLSNGRYSVLLRANGAGSSRWEKSGITRWRDDALRDAYGSFFYLQWTGQPQACSITQHPAPDPAADYHSQFHADRVCFDAQWNDIQAHTTVWISPEDDIEFRQVELRNLSDHALDVELTSAFEVTLSDPRADEAHPAFTNLFVTAEWLASQQALWFERKPRLASEQGLSMAHFLTDLSTPLTSIRLCTNRQRWQGRNHSADQPLADLMAAPNAQESQENQAVALDTGLDPVCALAVTLRIKPGAKARLTFATAASPSSQTLHAVVDKYRQSGNVQRASLMSATLTGIRLRALRLNAENFSAMQTLTSTLTQTLTRVQARSVRPESAATEVCDRKLLWRFGLSGDRPIILVLAGVPQGLGLLRALAQALNLWSWSRLACDLVVVNAEPSSYLMPLQRDITALRDRHNADCAAHGEPASTGFLLLPSHELSTAELSTLHSLARVLIHADGRPLAFHVQELNRLHDLAQELRLDTDTTPLPMATVALACTPSQGTFAATSADFSFEVSATQRPQRPWINVLANPNFGAHISEAGGGYTWAVNSRLNQLTAWSNDAVGDPPSEWFLLQNRKTGEVWRLTPSAGVEEGTTFQTTHGQGMTTIRHLRGALEVSLTWCVDAATAVKQIHVSLTHHGSKTQKLRLIGMVEWLMGANRSDRATVRTSALHQRLPSSSDKLTALLCTQRDSSAGFGGGSAFFGMVGQSDNPQPWTCDRREFFDARGRMVIPDYLGEHSGDGLDPCAALSTHLMLSPGETVEHTYLLGYAATLDGARQLVTLATQTTADLRLAQVQKTWNDVLGATTVTTPDPLLDALVNRWLLYQTLSCRLWAKAGFYQAGGATGFRDQLQDAMALSWAAPKLLRAQIVLCAAHQFEQGDVQHWWHSPLGNGVRTHFSDDLLWLAHACVHYLRSTGDVSLMSELVPFLEGPAIAAGAEDAYFTPSVSSQRASVYEHAARAIDRSLQVGIHGLPLMGSGDWNDGMNQVGIEGRGESVWLGWFLCQLVADFAPLAYQRGDAVRALRWEHAAVGWQAALLGPAWDGAWFKRAFFDNGQALGSHDNPEAQIDLIAQAWSVLSHAAPWAMQRAAMTAVDAHLVNTEAGLIQLLTPPLVNATPSAGYIQAYPPGVRENGGQYSHAGIWALMAQAELARSTAGATTEDSPPPSDQTTESAGDKVYRYFTYLSPAHRASHPSHGPVYGLEPYVMAGDVYSQPPYVGRGGWSWYTGAAAWLHRAAIESLFGLSQQAQTLVFQPCLPAHWSQAEITLVREKRHMRFILMRSSEAQALEHTQQWGAQLLRPNEPLHWPELPEQSCFVIPLPLVRQHTDTSPVST